MRTLGLRFLRIVTVATLAYLAIGFGNALGHLWLGYSVAGLLFFAYVLSLFLEQRKRAKRVRETRWEQAIFDGSGRAQAIREATRALGRIPANRPRSRRDYATLSILLAELHDAEGDASAAQSVIDAVPSTGLTKLDHGLVRHTQAVIHLRAADAKRAAKALEDREATGDLELDQRLELLAIYAQVEQGEAVQALERAEAITQREDVDDSVLTEARVVRAAALDALARREEALVVLAALGRDSLEPLCKLGQPRVRRLAQTILDGMQD